MQSDSKGNKDKKGSEKISRNCDKIRNKMALTSYLLIITLNVNGLNTLIKRYRVSERIEKNKTHLYSAYKWLILDLKTPTDWKLGGEETFIMQMNVKRKLDLDKLD